MTKDIYLPRFKNCWVLKILFIFLCVVFSSVTLSKDDGSIVQEILSRQSPTVTQYLINIMRARERLSSYLDECKNQNFGDYDKIDALGITIEKRYEALDLRREKWRSTFANALREITRVHKPDEVSEAKFESFMKHQDFVFYKGMRSVAFRDYLNDKEKFKSRCENLDRYTTSVSKDLNDLIEEYSIRIDHLYSGGVLQETRQDVDAWSRSSDSAKLISQSQDKQYSIYFSPFNTPTLNELKHKATGRLYLYDHSSQILLKSVDAMFLPELHSVSWNENSVGFKNENLPHWSLPKPINTSPKCASSGDKHQLEFILVGSSQINVLDADGCSLAYKKYEDGDVVKVSSSKVMTVFLSRPDVVSVLLDGVYFDFPTTEYSEGKYAKFSVGGLK